MCSIYALNWVKHNIRKMYEILYCLIPASLSRHVGYYITIPFWIFCCCLFILKKKKQFSVSLYCHRYGFYSSVHHYKRKKKQQSLKIDSHRKTVRLFTTNAVINLCETEYSFIARRNVVENRKQPPRRFLLNVNLTENNS